MLNPVQCRFSVCGAGRWLLLLGAVWAGPVVAQSPFAVEVVSYAPAPGQFVNQPLFADPAAALGPPSGGGALNPGEAQVVSLGGFGGALTLRFAEPVRDDAANPFGLDCIVFSNAFFVGGDPTRRWAEAAVIEIARDFDGDGLPDTPWYVIPGSHMLLPAAHLYTQTWDDDPADPTWPPADAAWLPPGVTGLWTTTSYRLPGELEVPVLVHPAGTGAIAEVVYGYADMSPTARLGDLNGDGIVDDPTIPPELFYTRPSDPFTVGVTPGSGGGDAFDIAWAIDPYTGEPANLSEFDLIRITTAVHAVYGILGELSAEIDAVANVRAGRLGDLQNDGVIDWEDFAMQAACGAGPQRPYPPSPCRVLDMDEDGDIDLHDFGLLQREFTGPGGAP